MYLLKKNIKETRNTHDLTVNSHNEMNILLFIVTTNEVRFGR